MNDDEKQGIQDTTGVCQIKYQELCTWRIYSLLMYELTFNLGTQSIFWMRPVNQATTSSVENETNQEE